MDFSTYSLPSTDLRISSPRLNSSSFMVVLLDVGQKYSLSLEGRGLG
jgi:hypothetical protein